MQLRLAARSVAGLLRAWDSVAAEVNGAAGTILCGGLFTHATKGGPYPGGLQGGLEFSRRDEEIRLCTTDITVETARIGRMTQLPWAPSAFLVLGGCKTAIASAPGHSPVAQTFALRLSVRTIGQQGVAYFSTRWNDFRRSTPADNEISLWAYARGRNVFPLFASDQRLPGIVFRGADAASGTGTGCETPGHRNRSQPPRARAMAPEGTEAPCPVICRSATTRRAIGRSFRVRASRHKSL